jgi:calcineurin-like phosphoesterase family protein
MGFRINLPKSRIWVTSDCHLNHDKPFIWGARGYKSCTEHKASWFDTVNAKVGKDDALIILGDYALNTTEEECIQFLNDIKCDSVYMIWGNHNNPLERLYKQWLHKAYPMLPPEAEMYPFWQANICFLGHYAELKVDSSKYILFHYPIAVWNHMSHDVPMLCGHSHGSFEDSRIEASKGKILDCGWDLHKSPINLEEIDYIMANKGQKYVDHHTPRVKE